MNLKRWIWIVSVTVAIAVAVGVAAQAMYVHSKTGYWGLSVSAAKAPSSVEYEGRSYDQGDEVKVPLDAVRRGHTDRDAAVFKPAGDEDALSVVIYVSAGDTAWEYFLVGGP
jgi:uncharacterized membrane protein